MFNILFLPIVMYTILASECHVCFWYSEYMGLCTALERRGSRRFTPFTCWLEDEVQQMAGSGESPGMALVALSKVPDRVVKHYMSMYAYGNHFRVLSSERTVKTCDSGVAATFKQVCRNGTRDSNQVNADVEYVGHIEEILELIYRRHCLVVLVCDFVKANYAGESATIKRDKWGFTLANYDRRYRNICRDSFAFPSHCEQVFFSRARESPGWRVVLRKEVRGRRVVPNNGDDDEAELFQMGEDENFEGLRPDREVGQEEIEPAATGEDVILEPTIRVNRGRRGGRGAQGRGTGPARNRRAEFEGAEPAQQEVSSSSQDEEPPEEERLYRGMAGQRRPRAESNVQPQQRDVRQQHLMHDYIQSDDGTSSETESSSTQSLPMETSSSDSSRNKE